MVDPGTPLPDPGFAGDDGAADRGLARALAAWQQDPSRESGVLHALAAARVLVPVVAVATGTDPGASGLRRESGTDMAVVTLHGEDGRRGLPVFSGLAALAAWDPAARPVPVPAPRAALSATAEGADVLVLDVAGPVRFVLAGPALRRLAEGDPFVPLYDDPEVLGALHLLLGAEAAVTGAWVGAAAGADARVSIAVDDPDAPAAVRDLVARLGPRLREDEVLRARVLRGVELALTRTAPPGARPLPLRDDT